MRFVQVVPLVDCASSNSVPLFIPLLPADAIDAYKVALATPAG